MTVTVETLEKLERKITLTLPVTTIQTEVDARLKKLARTVKMDGFRPGKVPMGQKLGARDLGSPEVQKLTDEALAKIVANGQRKMPPFKDALESEQIKALVNRGAVIGMAFDAIMMVHGWAHLRSKPAEFRSAMSRYKKGFLRYNGAPASKWCDEIRQ